MIIPKTMNTYCPKCRIHTEHDTSLYKRGRDRSLAEGNRRYVRKKKGYGGQPRSVQRKMSKTTKKQTLMLKCKVCNRFNQRKGIRLRKVEITV